MRFLIILTLIGITSPARAELVELGLSGSYRRSFLADSNSDQQAKDEVQAYTFSVSYYIREMTALEFSFTSGESERTIPSASISSITTHTYRMIGSDLVFTFAKKTDSFIPYVKAGLGYFINKEIKYTYINHGTGGTPQDDIVQLDPTFVPSVGMGMKTRVTKNFFIRTGIEVWTSGPINKDIDELDWAARLGLSWYL